MDKNKIYYKNSTKIQMINMILFTNLNKNVDISKTKEYTLNQKSKRSKIEIKKAVKRWTKLRCVSVGWKNLFLA